MTCIEFPALDGAAITALLDRLDRHPAPWRIAQRSAALCVIDRNGALAATINPEEIRETRALVDVVNTDAALAAAEEA